MTPYTGYGYGEWYMWTDGGLNYDRYNYDNSYGYKMPKRSPKTDYDYSTWNVVSDGVVNGGNYYGSIGLSYGHL